MFAQNQAVSTTTRLGLLGTSQGSRSTFAGSTVRRSGNVTSARRGMRFNQIGKLILRPVAQESTNVTVEPFSQGNL